MSRLKKSSIIKRLNTAIKLLKTPRKFLSVFFRSFPRLLPDKMHLKVLYRGAFNHKLDLDNPQTFSQKLQWLKLYDRKPEYTKMVDKYETKKYVADIIGEEYIIPTLGVWDKFEDIDFDSLPNQFVLKTTHDSGGVVICKDKKTLNIDTIKVQFNNSLKSNYYYLSREWPYKNVKPRIIAEKLMVDDIHSSLLDYKFMVFNGEMKSMFTCTERNTVDGLKVDFYDKEWNRLPFIRKFPNSKQNIKIPYNFKLMCDLSEKIAKKITACFVRLDFYEVENKLYFGEITFYPGGGLEYFDPVEWDYTFGSWINLPEKTECK